MRSLRFPTTHVTRARWKAQNPAAYAENIKVSQQRGGLSSTAASMQSAPARVCSAGERRWSAALEPLGRRPSSEARPGFGRGLSNHTGGAIAKACPHRSRITKSRRCVSSAAAGFGEQHRGYPKSGGQTTSSGPLPRYLHREKPWSVPSVWGAGSGAKRSHPTERSKLEAKGIQ